MLGIVGEANIAGNALSSAIGYPKNFDTYGQISGIYLSSFATGAFVGPLIGGPIVDAVGFSWGGVVVSGVEVVMTLLMLTYRIFGHKKRT